MLIACAAALVVHAAAPEDRPASLWLSSRRALIVGTAGLSSRRSRPRAEAASRRTSSKWIGGGAISSRARCLGAPATLRGVSALPLATIVAGGWIAARGAPRPGGAGGVSTERSPSQVDAPAGAAAPRRSGSATGAALAAPCETSSGSSPGSRTIASGGPGSAPQTTRSPRPELGRAARARWREQRSPSTPAPL